MLQKCIPDYNIRCVVAEISVSHSMLQTSEQRRTLQSLVAYCELTTHSSHSDLLHILILFVGIFFLYIH
eukprot:c23489_g1_i1 orf=867-1073(+)